VRALALVGLAAMGVPVLFVLCFELIDWLLGNAGWSVPDGAATAVSWALAAVLFVPLAWLAFRTVLDGVGLGRRVVRAWAAAHGWATGNAPERFEDRWRSAPFGNPRCRVLDLLRTDRRGTAFSMTYVIDGVPRHVVTTARALDGPAVRLTPRTLSDVVAGAAVGVLDIRTEWAAFDDRWRIESDDRRHASAMLHPRMLERLMQRDVADLDVLFESGDVAVHRPGRTALDHADAMADLVLDLAGLVPAYLMDDNPPLPGGLTPRQLEALHGTRGRGRA
jgi:hypothetical protein